MLDIKSSVLRFWETEFPQLKPMKSSTGQRYYTPKHIDIIKSIHKMLHVDKFTIIGAKKLLADKESMNNIITDIKITEEEEAEHLNRKLGLSKQELLLELQSIKSILSRV